MPTGGRVPCACGNHILDTQPPNDGWYSSVSHRLHTAGSCDPAVFNGRPRPSQSGYLSPSAQGVVYGAPVRTCSCHTYYLYTTPPRDGWYDNNSDTLHTQPACGTLPSTYLKPAGGWCSPSQLQQAAPAPAPQKDDYDGWMTEWDLLPDA